MNKDINITLSNDIFDRQEDVYSFNEFGTFVNRFSISQTIISNKFWDFLKSEYNIHEHNIIVTCDIQNDYKNREVRSYKYVITINKPHKILFVFYDEEKAIDPDLYKTEGEQLNKIYEILIYFQSNAYNFVNDDIIPKVKKMIYQPPDDKSFYLISKGNYGYELRSATIKNVEIDLEMNYGVDFIKKDKEIIDKLLNTNKGLFLFHGEPGTGKTTYIRKIINELSDDKTIIYVPSYMMYGISEPDMISFISKFKNSILLLEDAESILTNSTENRDQAVTNILNMSDGLLNDHLDMQIIATLNVDKKVIDEALLRKGRLMVNYKFKRLTSKQATKLSKYIGINKIYKSSATLAEVYNNNKENQLIDLVDINDKSKGIGFKL